MRSSFSLTRSAALSALGPLLAALGAALVVSVAQECHATFVNGHLREGLYFLPLFGISERFLTLILLVCVLAVPTTVLCQAILHTGRRRSISLACLGGIAVVFAVVYAVRNKPLFTWLTDPAGNAIQRFLSGQLVTILETRLIVWIAAVLVTGGLLLLLAPWGKPRHAKLRVGGVAVAVIGALISVFAVTQLRQESPGEPGRPNVILIVLDTVTATHMAGYGYHRPTTPEIDRLSEEGLLFGESFSAAPWTLPSHASMFTGLYPIVHGATQEHLSLDRSFVTVAELLKNEGYHTFGAINNAVVSSAGSKLDQGFTSYLEMYRKRLMAAHGKGPRHPTNRAVEKFLDAVPEDERYFIFLNYIEAHAPYSPPRAIAERFLEGTWDRAAAAAKNIRWASYYMDEQRPSTSEIADLRALYDAELAWLSTTIEDLVSVVESRGGLDDTLVIVTSDHGENIGDHDHLGHVFSLHDTVLRVPLIFIGAGLPKGIERSDPATSVDLFHTILAATRTPYDHALSHGRDLLAPDSPAAPDRGLVAEYYFPLQVLEVLARRGRGYESRFDERLKPYLCRMRSIRSDGWKLVWRSDGNHDLYNIAEDPTEQHNLIAEEPERLRELEKLLLARLSEFADAELQTIVEPFEPDDLQREGFGDLDEETVERLRALGYVQ